MVRELRGRPEDMNEWMQATAASDWTQADYEQALAAAARARMALGTVYDDYPVLLSPSTPGEAPADLESPSVSSFNRFWTLMHGPTISLPAGRGLNGMPLGLQFASRPGDDAALIGFAAGIYEVLQEKMA